MTAPAISPITTENPQRTTALPDLKFLDSTSQEYEDTKDAWEREERRLKGGDAVIDDELFQFDGESPKSFADRKKSASYVNFLRAHASTVTGRLRVHAPAPNWGNLGDVRTRDSIQGAPTFAELAHYNINGVGNDGMEFPAFIDEVDVRAQATGWRWLFWEVPERSPIAGPPSEAEVRAGHRPYLVEWSPLSVTNWYFKNGALQFAIVRVETDEPFEDGVAGTGDEGYYLLVRKGYTGFGAAFEEGGWWLFDSQKALLDSGPWRWESGEIPMWRHHADALMELGQIAVALMNLISMRDYDAIDAAASRTYFLNATTEVMTAVAGQLNARSVAIGVPPSPSTTGDASTEHTVSIYDSSSGAVASSVFKEIIASKYQEAQEQSIMQVSSIPSSSGLSKETGDREAKSPFLARRALQRSQSENTLIHFAELRFGFDNPRGFVQWPTEFDLKPVIDDIEAAFDLLRRSRLKSATLEQGLLIRSMEERGLLDPDEQEAIETELTASAAAADALNDMDRRLLTGGVPTLRLDGGADGRNADAQGEGSADAAGGRAGGGAAESRVRADMRGTAAGEPDGAPVGDGNREAPFRDEDDDTNIATAAVDLTPITDQIAALAEQLTALTTNAGPFGNGPLGIIARLRDTNPAYRITPETAVALLSASGIDFEMAAQIVAAETATLPPLDVPRTDVNPITVPASPDVAALAAKVDELTARVATSTPPPLDITALVQALTANQQKPASRLRFHVEPRDGRPAMDGEIVREAPPSDSNGTEP